MRSLRLPSSLPPLGLLLLPLLFLTSPPPAGAASLTDFEPPGFVAGQTVDNLMPDGNPAMPPITFFNQCVQAWFIPTAGTDEEIVDLSVLDPAHGKVWRISQGAPMGSLGQNPHSQHSGEISGETGASNDAGCGAPTTSTFYGELEFRSATGATQPGLGFAISANSSDVRHGFVRIFDDGAGFDLTFAETTDGCAFANTTIDTNLSYTDWHTLAISISFVEGLAAGTAGLPGALGNDVVRIFANGALVHIGTSWESCAGAESVDRLLIAASNAGSGTVIPAQLGAGLFFDNVFVGDGLPGPGPLIDASKEVSGGNQPGETVFYDVVLTNLGALDQLDNPGNEFEDTLPPQLTLVTASASTGNAVAGPGNLATWNGSIAPGASVVITLEATINPGTVGQMVSNQGTVFFDPDLDGINDTSAPTDDPSTPLLDDPTVFQVGGLLEIPTLSEQGLGMLALLLAAVAMARMRRGLGH